MKTSIKEEIEKLAKQYTGIVKAGTSVASHDIDGTLCFTNIKDFPHNPEPIGVRKDEKYDITFYSVPNGILVPAYDEETHSVVLAKPTGWSEHRNLDIEIVRLSSGKRIITDNDPRAIYGVASDDTELKLKRFTPTEALEHKVLVPSVYKNGTRRFEITECGELVESLYNWESTHPGTLEEGTVYFDWASGKVITDEEEELEDSSLVVPMNFEFGQFLGCMAGDGWWDHKDYECAYRNAVGSLRDFYLSDNEGCNVKFVESYAKKYFDKGIRITKKVFKKEQDENRYGDTVRYAFEAPIVKTVTQALNDLLGGERDENTSGSGNKHLPLWVAAAPEVVKFGILAGLLSTDGSVSVSKHKGEKRSAQLLVAITSTSLTLLEDTQNMIRTLGISSTIGFSKITTANNVSWILTISTPDIKNKEHELAGMCNRRKYEVLCSTPVTSSNGKGTGLRRVLFPEVVADHLLSWIPQPKLKSALASGDEERIARTREYLRLAEYVRRGKKVGVVTEDVALALIKHFREERYAHSSHLFVKNLMQDLISRVMETTEIYKMEHGAKIKLSDEEFDYLEDSVAALASPILRKNNQTAKAIYTAADKIVSKVRARKKVITQEEISMLLGLAETAREKLTLSHLVFTDHIYCEWEDMALGGFTWSVVEEVIKTGIKETGYDLTVPGYETFVSADGVVLSNTINVHVPSSDAAVKEAKEVLMPSTFPFSNRNQEEIVPLPKQEQILGLYTAATSAPTPVTDFATEAEALEAIKTGKIPLSADISINGKV